MAQEEIEKHLTDFLIKKSNQHDITLYKNAHEISEHFIQYLNNNQPKSNVAPNTSLSLQECKDKFAKQFGYDSWKQYKQDFPTTNDENWSQIAELYATSNRVEEKEAWISVEERLPELGERVLIMTGYGGFDVCYLNMSNEWHNSMRPGHSNGEVTHWMPLPEPPKI